MKIFRLIYICIKLKKIIFVYFLLQTGSYELRHYFKSKWTSTEITSSTYEEGTSQGFRKLFNYIQGQNSLSKYTSKYLLDNLNEFF